ncbi:MAG: cytochrome c oxidase subunit II [Hyphomicrobiales bacterium]|nr:cytochrome c oxidase subunit II [Hyphomicrobiales bacterium]MBV9519180.1 cytochrome c oxidase subunit II [Hyphomicrobiales bacterium]
MRSGFKPLLGAVCAFPLSGCIGWQSALSPHGAQSGSLLRLIWLFVVVCAVVWILVIVVLAVALFRRRPIGNEPPLLEPSRESRLNGIIAAATVMTVLVIGTLTLVSFVATRGLDSADENVLTLRMRGFQWWWEITYLDASRPDRIFLSPNEIHVPVGRPVRVRLSADDVIHSFWVPSLAGKKDLIPGRDNAITFTATRPGVYRGQCAEFCGLQHAHMAFLVIAETPQSFEAWRRSQIAEAASPSNDEEKRGQSVFTVKACAACHTVRGTSASGSLGPDLTHVASRRYIASGLLETTRGSLAAWIADPQTLKPGSNMPSVPLSSDELRDVSAYMASLK